MEYRRFGRTELSMPHFSCGGMRYQQSWDDLSLDAVEAENQRNLEATLRRALELGINHIETARGYGTSERQIGVALPKLIDEGWPREEIILQTKVAPEADPQLFRKHVEESLEKLKVDYVDLLGLHGINTHDHLWQSTRPGGCLDVARELKAEGKVRHIGCSTHGSRELIIDLINTGEFDYVNLHWYYIYQHNWPAVEAAKQQDMGVFIISPSQKGGMLFAPTERLTELCQPLHPLVFNCLFCLRNPEVHTLSLGASQPSDFDLQMSSLPLLKEVDKLLPPIVERLDEAMSQAMGSDYVQHWREGLPEWEDAPGYMNVPIILWLRSLVLAYGMTEYGKMRYNLLGNGGHWFPGLNAAHVEGIDPEQFATALKNSPFKEQIPGWLKETHNQLGGEAVQRLSKS